MFTGIVEETGTVRSLSKGRDSAQLTVKAGLTCDGTKAGDSIAVNGVCLTVTHLFPGGFGADIMAETLRRSTLGSLTSGAKVNLERACQPSTRLGGHMISGHVDGIGTIKSILKQDIARIVNVECDANLLRYITKKGSVTVDGISLTICAVSHSRFTVSVIPHTANHTTIGRMIVGSQLNIECDMVAKYVDQMIGAPPTTITEDYLRQHGFMEA